ncbi:MAG TPA: PaaI family thioesterase [Afipia sp.]
MSERFFEAIVAGKIPPPECAKTLGLQIIGYDLDAHTVELEFDGKPEFANPIGIVQGGFLSAMLDDTMGLASATAMNVGEFAPTLGLNAQFHRPAKIGKLTGKGRITMRGKDIFHLAAELFQGGKLVASATATAMIRKM